MPAEHFCVFSSNEGMNKKIREHINRSIKIEMKEINRVKEK